MTDWKTTSLGLSAALAVWGRNAFPKYAPYFDMYLGLGLGLLGYHAADKSS